MKQIPSSRKAGKMKVTISEEISKYGKRIPTKLRYKRADYSKVCGHSVFDGRSSLPV